MDAAINPLLVPWDAPFGLPPFDLVRPEHFKPAFERGMGEHRDELARIATHHDAPTFHNTLAAFDASGRLLSRVEALFHNLAASATSDALQAVQRAMAAPLAAHWSAVYMDAALFQRVDVLFASRDTLNLNAEQRRLLERVHLDFVRSGARLQGGARQRYAQVMQRLAELTTTFAQNVLHDEATFALELRDEADLAGLPAFLRAAAQQAAAERGLAGGHTITLARSSKSASTASTRGSSRTCSSSSPATRTASPRPPTSHSACFRRRPATCSRRWSSSTTSCWGH